MLGRIQVRLLIPHKCRGGEPVREIQSSGKVRQNRGGTLKYVAKELPS